MLDFLLSHLQENLENIIATETQFRLVLLLNINTKKVLLYEYKIIEIFRYTYT